LPLIRLSSPIPFLYYNFHQTTNTTHAWVFSPHYLALNLISQSGGIEPIRPQANGALMLHPGSMVFLHKTTRASSVLCSRDHVMIRSDAHRVTVMLTLGHWLYAALTAHFRNSCPVQDSCTVTDERALPFRCLSPRGGGVRKLLRG